MARTAQIRADLKMLAPLTRAIRTYSSTGGVELVPGIASEFGLRVTVGAWIDKNQDRNEREIRSVDRSRQAPQQRQRHHRRQRNHLPRRAEGQRPDPADPAREALNQRTGDDRRNLARLDRASRAGFGGRLHRRAHPALLGRLLRRRKRSIRPILIYDKLRQAYPGKRIVIAEFGWPSAGYNLQERQSGPDRAGRRVARFRHPRRSLWHRLQHRRSDRSAVEDFRRRRRPILGNVRRRAPSKVRLDRPDHRSRSLAACRRSRSW